jgi:choline dehydrogenase
MDWDYIIVGAGSAGCVLANRLSADAGVKVLLIESGGSHRTPLVTIPAGEARVIGNPGFDWKFVAEPDPSVNGRADAWPRGKVLGGSSSINGMMWIRGQREDFDGWAQMGNPGWSYDDVLPLFRRSESNDIDDATYHGRDGELTVSTVATPHRLAKTFIAAGRELGIPYNSDVNGAVQEGIGPTQGNIRRGRRASTAAAFLDPVRRRRNLEVMTKTSVVRLLIENARCTGVVCRRKDGSTFAVRCAGEVILSAGSIMSPAILMRSGLGPGEHLTAHGIDIAAHIPGVGRNLQEHTVVWSSGLVSVSTYNTELGLHKWPIHGLNWLLRGKGPASTPIAHAAAFVRTREGSASPDVQLSFVPTGYKLDADGLKLLDRPAIVIGVNKCRPQSVGHVDLRSASDHDAPRIHGNLLGERADVDDTIAGLKLAQRFYQTRAFAPYYQGPNSPEAGVETDDQLEAYVRATGGPAYHPVGTCKMGPDPMAVVDARLRVRGIAGLRVADASIMPRMTSGNTNAPTIMIGEKASDLIRADRTQ